MEEQKQPTAAEVNAEKRDAIIMAVASVFNVEIEQLFEKTRKRAVVTPRQLAMKLIADNCIYSLEAIGDYFGGKDHATVIHSRRVVDNLTDTDPEFRAKRLAVEKQIAKKKIFTTKADTVYHILADHIGLRPMVDNLWTDGEGGIFKQTKYGFVKKEDYEQ